jgi:hypothetical protein
MIAYFDTSAVVPILLVEHTSNECRRLWRMSDLAVTCRLTYVEVIAAIAQAHRSGRTTTRRRDEALRSFEALWSRFDVLEFDRELSRAAAVAALRFGLRSYDSVHCASALSLKSDGVVAVSGDRALLRAWSTGGVAVADPSTE